MNPVLLRGKKVVGTEGYILGEMNDLHVDFNTWQATAFYVILSDEAAAELNLKKPFLRKIIVALPISLVKAVGDVITLKAPIRGLKDIAEREMQVTTHRVEGKKVINQSGRTFGVVEGLDVDVDDWKVTGLEVALNSEAASELGYKPQVTSKVIVVVPGMAVGAIENFVTLDKSVQDLKSLVECIQSCQLQK
jgi:sporulation protein YlmC with PRC-barrel domain